MSSWGTSASPPPAIRRLARRGADILFLGMDGAFHARLAGGTTPHTALRRQQYARQADPAFSLCVAQRLVVAKIRNQRVLLQRHARQRQVDLQPEMEDLALYEARAAESAVEAVGMDPYLGFLH